MTSVVKIEKDEIIYFKAYLSSRNDILIQETKNPHEAFRAKYNDSTIIGYTSGNIVINNDKIKPIINDILFSIRGHKLNFDIMIGSDEAGKGEWLGPLVIAAVALNPKQVLFLQGEGVRDSKLLKSNNLLSLSNLIKSNSIDYQIISIHPKEFNDVFKQIKLDGGNLNDLLAQKHFLSINNILNKNILNKKIKIVTDEFDKVKTDFIMKDISSYTNIEFIQKPKAEEEIAVAAASILARNEREKIIDDLSNEYSIELRTLNAAEVLTQTFAKNVAKLNYIKKNDL